MDACGSRARPGSCSRDVRVGERALLIAVPAGRSGVDPVSLDELERLAETAGAETVERIVQRRERLDPATLVGSGKLAAMRRVVEEKTIDVVIFDEEITPAQERNIAGALGCRVLDRTALILDIFAQHATSREGRTQVELAQLEYRLPRLRGRGVEMSRLGGGIGTRGPGETKLEVDRRRIQRRIAALRRDLRDLERTRRTKRMERRRSGLPMVALVGYTNAGKSSLLNVLTDAGAPVEDQLFATLDPMTRRCLLGGGREVLLTDTVGFVRRLPHELVEAFRSTLELVTEADLLLHLVDLTEPDVTGQIAAVRQVLGEIGASNIPELLVGSKVDLVAEPERRRFVESFPEAVMISTVTGERVGAMTERMWEVLSAPFSEIEVIMPFGAELERLHAVGDVLETEYRDDGVRLRVRVPPGEAARFHRYAV